MKPKILVFAPKSPHTAKFVEMIEDDVDCFLVVSTTDLEVEFNQPYQEINQRSIKGICTTLKNLWLSKHNYIHVHSLNFTALLVSIFAIKPIIITAWGSDVLLVPKRSKVNRLITKFILWRAAKVTANSSNNMKQAIHELNPKIKVHDVHFGVSKHCKATPFKEKQNIIYSPRGHANLYNIDKVIDAFANFYMQNPDWRLVISGMQNAANTPKLKGQAKDLPIDFTGWLSPQENANWNAKAKIVVSIPSSDALSVSLMEAIYSNCICFVSDLPPNREVITDGVNGFVGCDFERYTEIDANILQQENAKLSQNWTYDFNKKSFLSLYE